MFLHLGADVVINKKYIVAIMDLETTSVSKITKEYLKKATKENRVINISSEDLPKSYVITNENGEKKIYVSPISSQTLNKRANNKEYLYSTERNEF